MSRRRGIPTRFISHKHGGMLCGLFDDHRIIDLANGGEGPKIDRQRSAEGDGNLTSKTIRMFSIIKHVSSRLLYSVCLLSGYIPNSLLKELFHDVTFTILLASLTLYLIGLIYTIPRSHTSHRHLNSYTRPYQSSSLDARGVWIPQPMIVDAFGFFVLLGPIVSLNAFAILSGFYMDHGEPEKASFWITLHYIVWSFFCWVIIASLVYFGSRLTGIILRHIEDTKEAGRAKPMKLRNLEQGLKKLRLILSIIVSVLVYFAISSLIFGSFRNFILTFSPFLSHALAASWILIVPTMNVVIITILAMETNNREPLQILPQTNISPIEIPVLPYDSTSSKTDEAESYPMRPMNAIALEATRFTSSNDDSKISELSYQQRSLSQSQIEYLQRNSSPTISDHNQRQPMTPSSALARITEPPLSPK
ncbi:16345_t:CDS:2 [Acaulospora morrowiae]|uniref:16345_t:CDS:1 n=1 Tax=Acaulospora morrowiae TaxID=94023 RepID=A0A9N9B1H7_9GLOM|nr:16345_t:CDS:2 [Acaulospora morrowiae]